MNILVIGSGGREHAIIWKLAQSKCAPKIYCAPGNGGTEGLAENVQLAADDVNGLLNFAKTHKIDLTVVGPEVPLTAGIVDLFEKHDLKIFGPNQKAAQLEGSKLFSKQLMAKYQIPTAVYASFTQADQALSYLQEQDFPIVIKADGLAAGKGVVIAQNFEEAQKAIQLLMYTEAFRTAGKTVVIEEFMQGEEASLLAFTDGKTIVPMASAQDHKAIFEGDNGPNTGGMGAYSPAPVLTENLTAEVQKTILEPTIAALKKEGIVYKGVLYAGLMITKAGPKVVEFNVRFGDPETQVILPRLKTDLAEIMLAVIEGRLSELKLEWTNQHCLSVVMAAGGYPGSYEKGKVITGLESLSKAFVFHAGTILKDNTLLSSGGRVLNVTALGNTLREAADNVYSEIDRINFEDKYFRRDIGWRALENN